MRSTILASLFFAITSSLFAQKNLKPGYIVRSNGDTIRVLINLKEWARTPQKFEYAATENDPTSTIDKSAIRAVYINGVDHFVKGFINISMEEVSLNKLSQVQRQATNDTVMLQVVNSGKHGTFYQYIDDVKSRFYFQTKHHEKIEELAFRVLPYGSGKVNYLRAYRNQLFNVVKEAGINNKKLETRIQNAEYRMSDLTKIFYSINENESVKTSSREAALKTFVARVGINYTTPTWSGSSSLDEGGSQTNSLFPVISAGIAIYAKPSVRRTFLQFDIGTFSTKTQMENTVDVGSADETSKNTLEIHAVNVGLGGMYALYNGTKIKWYVGGGAKVNCNIKGENEHTITSFNRFTEASSQRSLKMDIKQVWINYNLKTQVQFNRHWSIDLTYIPNLIMADESFNTIAVGGFGAGVTYQRK